MLEKDVEKLLVQEVKKLGGRAYKFVSPGNTGVPDRIVIFPDGKVRFVELKTDKGKLTPNQGVQIARLRDLKQKAFVAYGVDGVSHFFQDNGYTETSKAIDARYDL